MGAPRFADRALIYHRSFCLLPAALPALRVSAPTPCSDGKTSHPDPESADARGRGQGTLPPVGRVRGGGTHRPDHYFFRFGRCVSADAAAVLAAGEDFGLRRTFAAAEAARALVTSEFLRRNMAMAFHISTGSRGETMYFLWVGSTSLQTRPNPFNSLRIGRTPMGLAPRPYWVSEVRAGAQNWYFCALLSIS